MKPLRIALMAVMLIAAAHAAPWHRSDDEPHQKTVEQLLNAIRVELPKGWTVSYDKEDAWLEVARTEEVRYNSSNIPNSSPFEPEKLGEVQFTFRVVSFVSAQEYRRLSTENAKIEKDLGALYDELVKRHVWHKFDRFSPRDDEEKKLVSKYEAIKQSGNKLPDLYFRDISLEWSSNSPNKPYRQTALRDPTVKAECTKVQEKLARIMEKYESSPKPNQ